MRIATWNVNGMNARIEFVLHWLRAREPDVVGLQELKQTDEQFPRMAFEALGYEAATHGQKSWNGVAVLSRKPMTVVQTGLPGQEDLGARFLATAVDGIEFTTVYVPNGKAVDNPDFPEKLAWIDGLMAHIGDRWSPDRPAVLCGDFNVVPQPVDSWDEERFRGHIFHTDEERSRFGRLLDWGLVDLYRHAEPQTQSYSWWDYRAGAFHKGHGLRIDLLLGTPAVADRVTHVEIDREYRKKKNEINEVKPSDHAPVIVDLD